MEDTLTRRVLDVDASLKQEYGGDDDLRLSARKQDDSSSPSQEEVTQPPLKDNFDKNYEEFLENMTPNENQKFTNE